MQQALTFRGSDYMIGIMEGSLIERRDKIINAIRSVKSEEELNKVLIEIGHEIIESHLVRYFSGTNP